LSRGAPTTRGSPSSTPRRAHAERRPAPVALPPPTRTSLAIALLAAVACMLVSLTFRIVDYDFWEHVAIGRAIWSLGHVPTTQLWTWPTYGAPDVNIEWGYQALLWPIWQLGRLRGIYAWDWLSAGLAFALVWLTARAMGARGHVPLLVIAIGVLTYRQRSVGRPETLAAILLAAEIWLLELRRSGQRNTLAWLPLVALLWVNSHITFVLGLLVMAIYLAGEWLQRGARAAATAKPMTRELLLVLEIAIIASFLNPFGWRALAEPLRYAFSQRHEALYRTIGELMPLPWGFNTRNGLPILMALWPLLQIWRAARRRFDLTEALLCVAFTALTLMARRLVGMWVLMACVFIARDLSEWIAARAWPAWLRPAWARGTTVAVACVVLSLPEWSRAEFTPGVGVDPTTYPAAAAEFMQAQGIQGRGFNHFEFGGYLLWRFWPDRTRLPFMDIRQAGTPEIRQMFLAAQASRDGWEQLDQRHRFDYVLLHRIHARGDVLLDVLDADSTWSLVFTDDAAALYVRREGPYRALADSHGYAFVGGSTAKLESSWAAAMRDSLVRGKLSQELARVAAESPVNSTAHSLLAYVAAFEGRYREAQVALKKAHDVDPQLPRYHDRLGYLLLSRGALNAARAEYEIARRRHESEFVNYGLGVTLMRLGDLPGARRSFAAALKDQPDNQAARDSIAAIDARAAR
jgi:tetratricopeptide (TPR) repeat protein